MPVAAESDAGLWPAFSDMPGQAAQMGAHFDAGRRLAGPQHDRDGAGSIGVVDVDRQKTALVIMGVEQRKLLMAVNDIAGVVDVERDRCRRRLVGGNPLIDEGVGQPDDVFELRRILQPRQCRLRTQVRVGVGQPPAGQFERRVAAQEIQIVGVLIAAGDGVDAGADHVGARMADACRIAVIWKAARQPVGESKALLGHRQQHDAAVRREPAAVESGCDFLAGNGRKRKW